MPLRFDCIFLGDTEIPTSSAPESLRKLLIPVKPLLGGTVAFTMGNSLLGVVLPLKLEAADYPVALTGLIMAAYFLGLGLGGFRAKHIIMRIGHIRAFAAFAALTSAVCLAYAFFFNPAAWVILRVINGFCIAGMTTTIESWLNERSSNKTRGRVLGVYMLCFYLAIAVGQTLVNLAPLNGSDHLMMSAALIGLSLIPIALTKLGEPNLSELRVLGVKKLFEASRVGVVGAAVAGMLVGSFAALGVVCARQIGLSVAESAMFMSSVVIGGLAFQLPVGVLADRFDRRVVMSCILITVGVSWLLLSNLIATGVELLPMLAMALVFGAANNSVYPLCVAQTFDRLDRKYYVAASGRLLMIYSVGATIGPLVASALMSLYGPPSFFIFESTIAMTYAVFVLMSVKFGPGLPDEGEREKFVQVPDVSPVAMRLDPRTEPDEEDEAEPAAQP